MEVRWNGTYWICLTQDRNQWKAFVNMEIKLWVSYIIGKF
jgi:hypothetical protein